MTMSALGRRRAALHRQIVRLTELVDTLGQFPDSDPYRDGAVVTFTLRWESTTYTYAAVKAGGKWYTTATSSSVFRDWLAFVGWMASAAEIVSFTDMVPVVGQFSSPESEPDDGEVQVFPRYTACPANAPHGPHRWAYEDASGERPLVCAGFEAPGAVMGQPAP